MPGRARAAVSAVFLVNGIVVASWAPLIPEIKARHGLGDAQLGLVLLAMAAGAVLSLPVAGWLVGRLGSDAMTSVAALGLCLALPLPIISPTVTVLVATLAILAYTGWFTRQHFADSIGWPLALIVFGLFMIGLSALAFRIDRDYVRA